MMRSSRRVFLGSLGSVLAFGLGGVANGRVPWASGLGAGWADALDFGRLEALAALLQETAPDELQRALIEKLRGGLGLEDLVAAAALANARSFGGHDYTGYHCFMALMPAWEMAGELRGEERWLPVLKVVHRQARQVEATGGRDDALQALSEAAAVEASTAGVDLRGAFEARDVAATERAFRARADATAQGALDEVQSLLRETLDVHRVVLTWRAWDVLQLTGEEHAETLLRQSLRWFLDAEQRRVDGGKPEPRLRGLLPDLLDEHGLHVAERGTQPASDGLLEQLADAVFSKGKADAARTVATALGEGLAHEDVAEALTLAANRLLLHDPGRPEAEEGKPEGSVHGASVGLHASDAARAWRNLAAVSDARNSAANLIAGAYHTAGQSRHVGGAPFAFAGRLDEVRRLKPVELVPALDEAVRGRDQELAGAIVAVHQAVGLPAGELFRALLAHSIEADGALHAEKYYRTVREDHATSRPAHRVSHLVALARVCASQAGFEAPGLADARAALKG